MYIQIQHTSLLQYTFSSETISANLTSLNMNKLSFMQTCKNKYANMTPLTTKAILLHNVTLFIALCIPWSKTSKHFPQLKKNIYK